MLAEHVFEHVVKLFVRSCQLILLLLYHRLYTITRAFYKLSGLVELQLEAVYSGLIRRYVLFHVVNLAPIRF